MSVVINHIKSVHRRACLTLCALTVLMAGFIFLDGATNASYATHNVAVVPSTDCSACHLPASQADFIVANPSIVHRDYPSMQTPTGALDCTKCHQTNGVLTPTNTIPEVIAAIAKGTAPGGFQPVYCSDCHNFLPNVAGNHEFDPNGHENTFVDDPLTCSAVGCHVDNVYTEHVITRGTFCFSCHEDALGDPASPLYRPEVVDAINRGSGDAATNPDFDPNGVNCSACHTTAGDHEAQHDMTRADSPDCLTAGCHYSDNVVTEHVVERGWTCQTCHDPSLDDPTSPNYRPEIPATILKGTGDPTATPPVPAEIVVCTECHIGGGDHVSVHDTTFLPTGLAQDCTLCHVDNVVEEHRNRDAFTNPDGSFNCGVCHESTDPVILAVIEAGRSVNNPNNDPTFCIACHDGMDGRPIQGEGHPAVSVIPWVECVFCHRSTSLLDPATGLVNDDHVVHDTHNDEAELAGFDCTLCHVPAPQKPNCAFCHDNNTDDPRLNIIGPGDEAHDFHTNPTPVGIGRDCTDCHTDGVPGGDPIPAPYNVCSNCHNGIFTDPVTGLPVTDIAFGSPVHDSHMAGIVNGNPVSCSDCHIPADQPGVDPICTSCHDIAGPNMPDHDFHTVAPQTFDCMECHVNGIPGSDPLPEPYSECSSCHNGTVEPTTGLLVTDIAYGTPVHDGHIDGLDMNGVPIDPNGIDCSYCHSATPQCLTCHDIAGPNMPDHDFHTDPPQSFDCDRCHVSGVPGGPIPPPYNECSVCHNGEDGTTDIRFGAPGHDTHMNDPRAGGECDICHVPAGQVPDCTFCHPVEHHDTTQAQTGDCTYCHGDPRPVIEPTAFVPTGQLACRQCHGTNKHDKGGPIQDFSACFACHLDTVRPYHAKPTTWPGWYEEKAEAPGRGTFNLFRSEFRPNCAGDCEDFSFQGIPWEDRPGYDEDGQPARDQGRNWGSPAISFDWVTFFDFANTQKQWTVPTFGDTGGGDPPTGNDTVTITLAEYDRYHDRLTVYAENSMGNDNNTELTLVYNGQNYPMSWSSWQNRWEKTINTSSCNDSTIEVISSAGGSASASVNGCEAPPPTPQDSVNITRAQYDDGNNELEVRAENSLGDNATLSVIYDGNSYEMRWDSGDDRWEIKIDSSSCTDSTIEVVSSEGGSDSSSVQDCGSSGGSWGSWGH